MSAYVNWSYYHLFIICSSEIQKLWKVHFHEVKAKIDLLRDPDLS